MKIVLWEEEEGGMVYFITLLYFHFPPLAINEPEMVTTNEEQPWRRGEKERNLIHNNNNISVKKGRKIEDSLDHLYSCTYENTVYSSLSSSYALPPNIPKIYGCPRTLLSLEHFLS